jgi:hypothetical protein
MSEHTDRAAMLREIAKKNVVYKITGMEVLRVRRDLTYRSTSGAGLLMDVYYPSVSPSKHPPTMLLPMAYPDPTAGVRSYAPLTSWARLMAASGMAAVVYGAEAPEEDVHAVLRQLRSDADALGLDIDRFGLFAASGNVSVRLIGLDARQAGEVCSAALRLHDGLGRLDSCRRHGPAGRIRERVCWKVVG